MLICPSEKTKSVHVAAILKPCSEFTIVKEIKQKLNAKARDESAYCH